MLNLLRTDRAFNVGVSRLVELLEPTIVLTDPDPAAKLIKLWEPNPGPQTDAYYSLADELFYGGAGGGGKTDLELGLALTAHRRSIIFRREFTQFRGAQGIFERAREIIGLHGRPSRDGWRDIPGDRSLDFGAVKKDKDKEKWRGRPHDLKAYDELPDFPESHYRFLNGWLRTTFEGQRTRSVGTGNPPATPEGQWVIRYWGPWLDERHPNPAKPGQLRYYAVIDGKDVELKHGKPFKHDGQTIRPRSRTFIPAKVEDNPHYMKTGYVDVLNSLPEPLRSQMRHGDFTATQGDHMWQVIPTAWVKKAQQRWLARHKAHDGVPPEGEWSAAGVDPSRGGAAEFVIARRKRNWIAPLEIFPGIAAPDGKRGAGLIQKAVEGDRQLPINIDIIGAAGSSVYDSGGDLGLRVFALNGSESTDEKDKSGRLGFYNKRALWHWRMREYLDPDSGQDLELPPDPQLLADLCAARWHPTPRGIQVEKKLEIMARLGRSPDRGEGVIYCAAVDVQFDPHDVLSMGDDAHEREESDRARRRF